MNKEIQTLYQENKQKVIALIHLVEASLERVKNINPEKINTPLELEPFDALCDRFVRATEVSIQFFKTCIKINEAIIPDTYRDILLKMEKFKLITSMPLWIEMRDVRNRVVHDYLPTQRKKIYGDIINQFSKELLFLKSKIENI